MYCLLTFTSRWLNCLCVDTRKLCGLDVVNSTISNITSSDLGSENCSNENVTIECSSAVGKIMCNTCVNVSDDLIKSHIKIDTCGTQCITIQWNINVILNNSANNSCSSPMEANSEPVQNTSDASDLTNETQISSPTNASTIAHQTLPEHISDTDSSLILAAGIACGVLVILIVSVLIAILLCRRRRRNQSRTQDQSEPGDQNNRTGEYIEIDDIKTVKPYQSKNKKNKGGPAVNREGSDSCYGLTDQTRAETCNYKAPIYADPIILHTGQSTQIGSANPSVYTDVTHGIEGDNIGPCQTNEYSEPADTNTRLYALVELPNLSKTSYESIDNLALGFETKDTMRKEFLPQSTNYEDIDKICSNSKRDFGGNYDSLGNGRNVSNSILDTYDAGSQYPTNSSDSKTREDMIDGSQGNEYTRVTSDAERNQRNRVTDSFLTTYGPSSESSMDQHTLANEGSEKPGEISGQYAKMNARDKNETRNSVLATYNVPSQTFGHSHADPGSTAIAETSPEIPTSTMGHDAREHVYELDSMNDNEVKGNMSSLGDATLASHFASQDYDSKNVYFELMADTQC